MNPFGPLHIPAVFVLLATAMAACGTATPPPNDGGVETDRPQPDGGAVRVELGTGQLHWEDLSSQGTRVELIHGPQGGYHIFGRVRFEGVGPEVHVRFRVTPLEGGAPVNDPNDRLRLVPGRGLVPLTQGWETSNAQLVVLTTITGPAAVVGRRFRFEAIVSSVANADIQATDTREVVIVDDT
jgi:hypothetical protein